MSDQSLTPEEIETQIEAQRAQLADTVDQLAHKFDVKAQARSRLAAVRPQQVAAAIGLLVAGATLFWWSRHR